MFCQNSIIAYSNEEEKELGFVDLYTYLKDLVVAKEENKEIVVDSKLHTFNLDTFQNMTAKQIRSKIGSLKTLFQSRNSELESKAQKLKDLQIINDTELPHSESQLQKINKILSNQNFINNIKLIQNRMKSGNVSEADKIKYSFYKELEQQSTYLKNFKIGSFKKYSQHKSASERNGNETKKVMNGLVRQMKKEINMNVSLTQNDNVELDQVLAIWSEQETRRVIVELDREFTRDMNTSKLNLKGKVAKSLANFLNITITQATVMMKDVNFRAKLFGNLNMEDVQNKLNIINNELNEHQIVKDLLRMEEAEKVKKSILKFTSTSKVGQRYPGFEAVLTEKIQDNKVSAKGIKKLAKKETVKRMMEKSLKSTYKNLLNDGIISSDEYKVIVQIIDEELKRVQKLSNLNEIKATIKVHIARMLINNHLIEANVYSPLKTVSATLEKIFGDKNLGQIVNFENMFNNIINYESNKPFAILKDSMNNMINLLIDLKGIEINNVVAKTDDLLYKNLGTYTSYGDIKKGKGLNKVKMTNDTVYAGLNIMNLILMTSYTEKNNTFTSSLQEFVGQKVELLENKIDNKIWTWASKEKSDKIISAIFNDEKFEFKEIVNEMMDSSESIELSNAMIELKALTKNLKESELKLMKKQFNGLYNIFFNMYKLDIVPHNLNKMKSTKSFDDLSREYFLGLQTGLYMKFIEKLMNKSSTKRMKNYIIKNLSIVGMYLNEESKYLKITEERQSLTVEEETESNKDELLNNFMNEDINDFEFAVEDDEEIIVDVEQADNIEDFDFDVEDEEIQSEDEDLFGSDDEDLFGSDDEDY